MGIEGSEGIEGIEAGGPGAVVGGGRGTDGGTDGVGAGGSLVCSAIGDRSPSGLSAAARPRLVPEGEDERNEA